MAKIQMRIRDKEKKVIAGAALQLRSQLKNGEAWQSERLRANNSGVIWLEIDDKLMRRIDWQKLELDVRHEGKKLEARHSQPEKINRTAFTVDVTVKRPSEGAEPSQPDPESEFESEQEPEAADEVPSPPTEPQPFPDHQPQPEIAPDPELEGKEEKDPGGYIVAGKIVTADGRPDSGRTVVAYDRDIAEEVLLGQARSGAKGGYRIPYSRDQFVDKKRKRANLIVRVFAGDDFEGDALASSPLIIRAHRRESVNLSTSAERYRGLSSYEQIKDTLRPNLKKIDLSALRREDVFLLADRTGLPVPAVAQFLRAWQMAARFGKTPGEQEPYAILLYALLRSGMTPNFSSLARLPERLLDRKLRQAQAGNWIPRIKNRQVLIDGIREARAVYVLEKDENSDILLTQAGLDARQKKKLLRHLLQEEELSEEGLQRLAEKSGIKAERLEKLRETIEMKDLLGGNARLLKGVMRDFKLQKPRDLARLSQEELEKLIVAELADLPDTMPGGEKNERARRMARSVNQTIEATYPTAAFANRLAADDGDAEASARHFFKENPDFDFERGSVRRQLAGKTGAGVEKQCTEAEELESLFHITPVLDKYENVKALQGAGIKSARDVTKLGRSGFRKKISPAVGGTQVADEIFARAEHTAAYELALATNVQDRINGAAIPMLSVKSAQTAGSQPSLEELGLFGASTIRQCNHCQSSLSPSAYLVDLLDFVSRAEDSGGKTGLAYLRDRRPDIEQLELDCDNSDNVLPYIDLVLEILENVVAPTADFALQTEEETTSLLAQPEHTNLAAYEPLQEKIYPWILPFDLNTTLTRAYLEQLGVPHYELLQTLYSGNPAQAQRQASGAYLGLTPKRMPLVAQPAGSQQFRATWGFQKNQINSTSLSIEQLIEASWLPLDVVSELLETDFVNPGGLQIIDENGQIKLLSETLLDHFYRLSRLYEWTRFSIKDLDLMLGCLATTDASSGDFINNLAALAMLNKEGGFSFEEMAGWWADPSVLDRQLFASGLGLTAESLDQLESLSDLTLQIPADALKLWQLIERIKNTGFSVEELLDLLTPPDADSHFSRENTESLIVTLQEAQKALINAEPETLPEAEAAADEEEITTDEVEAVDLADQQLSDLTEQTLADAWEIERTLLSALMDQIPSLRADLEALHTQPIYSEEQSPPENLTTKLVRLHKQAVLFDKLGLDPEDIEAIHITSTMLGTLKIAQLPGAAADAALSVEEFLSLADHQTVNIQHFVIDESLFRSVLGYKVEDSVNNLDDLRAALAADTDWPQDVLGMVNSGDGFAWNSHLDFLSDDGFIRLHEAGRLAEKLGIPLPEVWEFTIYANQPAELKAVLEANYPAEQWSEVARQIHDPQREERRDALLAYIMSQESAFSDPLDVYAHYLIDVEMNACYETSRTKQANASVQQFIQRILLNLEGNLTFTEETAKEWAWRKNYRIWEANRKVFIFPENWMEPELRDDKSEFFLELESQLLQDEVREDTAEAALLSYARKLHAVSNLEIAALLKDEETGIIYVIGRTRDLPHEYYLCRRSATQVWGSWEKIDLDIDADHLIPVVYNRRLHLFWPSFEEKIGEEDESYLARKAELDDEIEEMESSLRDLEQAIDDLPANIPDEVLESLTDTYNRSRLDLDALVEERRALIEYYTYLEVTLSWSQQDSQGAWTPTKMSKDIVGTIYGYDYYYRNRDGILFETSLSDDNQLSIAVMRLKGQPYDLEVRAQAYWIFGRFTVDICADGIRVSTISDGILHAELVNDSLPEKQDFKVFSSSLALSRLSSDLTLSTQTLLRSYPGEQLTVVTPPVEDENKKLELLGVEDGRTFVALGSRKGLSGKLPVPRPDSEASPLDLSEREEDRIATDVSTRPAVDVLINPGLTDSGVIIRESLENAGLASDLDRTDSLDLAITGGTEAYAASRISASPAVTIADATIDKLLHDKGDFLTPTLEQHGDIFLPSFLNDLAYKFYTFYHPYTCLFISQISRYGIEGLYQPDPESDDPDMRALVRQDTPDTDLFFFDNLYDPTADVKKSYPQEIIELELGQPYANYNWELFFHAPLLIAVRLMQDQRFEEAQQWFHYIFDPTIPAGGDTALYWRFGPFYDEQREIETGDFQDLLELAGEGAAEFNAQVAEWEANPFNPYAVGRLRKIAFMRATIMKYLDNLLAWGDHLFRRDTMESLNEALQIYAVAAQILGPKPILLDDVAEMNNPPTAYYVLTGSASVNASLAYAAAGANGASSTTSDGASFLNTLLTFCLPPNDKLLGYWDTVADRLFKLRNCMNIEGIVRKLPLYEPPIDPAMLVRAAAAGVSLADAVAGLNAPLPRYRFRYVLQKAVEFSSSVQSLGATLLSVLEKRDAEELALLRTNNEVSLLEAILQNRQLAIDETKSNLEAALIRQNLVEDRYEYFADREQMNANELAQMLLLANSIGNQYTSAQYSTVANIVSLIPQAVIGPMPATEYGGTHLGQAISAFADFFTTLSRIQSSEAGMAAITAQYERRQEEWDFQAQQATTELEQIEKEIISAELRIALAEVDLANQKLQIDQAEEAHTFLKDKYTNQELYSWMVGEISTLYFQMYQLAFDMAKQAEKAYFHELGVDQGSGGFIQYGYWDSLKKGLLSGEKLTLDLRRMETAYMNNNVRERELTKHVSLALLDPLALLQLKETGECSVTIPEAIFDLDFPGHYFRRIKSVSLTVPAVTGPYTTLGCTLTLESSKVRRSDALVNDEIADDHLIPEPVGQYQSISTSSGQNDSGVFQLDFRDERYLPFEGAGAVSTWQLRLANPQLAQFDYATISDVIVTLNYMAREATDPNFRTAVESNLLTDLDGRLSGGEYLTQLFTVRGHFADEWSRLLASSEEDSHTLSLNIESNLFPYLISKRLIEIVGFDVLVTGSATAVAANSRMTVASPDPDQPAFEPALLTPEDFGQPDAIPGLFSTVVNFNPDSESANPQPLGTWEISLTPDLVQLAGDSMEDLLLLCKYVVS